MHLGHELHDLAPTLPGPGLSASGKATFYDFEPAGRAAPTSKPPTKGVSGSYDASTSSIVTQVVNGIATTTVLTSGTEPLGLGSAR